MSKATCSIDDCEGKIRSRGWCDKHYTRYLRHGNPHVADQIHGDDKRRLLSRIQVDGETGCWLWRGPLNRKGYGQFRLSGTLHSASRASWLILRGPLGSD